MSDDYTPVAPRVIGELFCVTQERYAVLIRAEAEIERLREANKWLDAGRTEIVPILKERAERAEQRLRELGYEP